MSRMIIASVVLLTPTLLAAQLPDSTVSRIDRVFSAWATDSTPGCLVGIAQGGGQCS